MTTKNTTVAYAVRMECDDLDTEETGIQSLHMTRKEANTAMRTAMEQTLAGFTAGDDDDTAYPDTLDGMQRLLREGYEVYYSIVELVPK